MAALGSRRAGGASFVKTALAFSVVILASSFPYLFIDLFPAWIALGLLLFFLELLTGPLVAVVARETQIRFASLAWLALGVAALILNTFGPRMTDDAAGPILSLCTLLVFLGLVSAVQRLYIPLVVALIGAVALLQGFICVLQYLGNDWAWRFWEQVQGLLPGFTRVQDEVVQTAHLYSFETFGRARGTHVAIHVFNGVQAALVGALIGLSLSRPRWLEARPTLKAFLALSCTVGAIGVALTFSRSGILALFLSGCLGLLLTRRVGALLTLVIAVACVSLFSNSIRVDQAPQLNRLFSSSMHQQTNSQRLDHIDYALETFSKSPVLGESVLNSTGRELGTPIHSVPLRFLNDYGLVGLALYLAILFQITGGFLSRLRGSEAARGWAIAGLCAVSAVVADSWTHSSGFLRKDVFHAVLLALLLGAAITPHSTVNRIQHSKQHSPSRSAPGDIATKY